MPLVGKTGRHVGRCKAFWGGGSKVLAFVRPGSEAKLPDKDDRNLMVVNGYVLDMNEEELVNLVEGLRFNRVVPWS